MTVLSIGDVLRAHKAHSVECFLAPGDGTAGEVWVAEAWLTLDDPLDGRNAVRASGPSPEAAIDQLGRKLNEREAT